MDRSSQDTMLVDLYRSQKCRGDRGETARALLRQTHWFTVNADFDPKTGEALPQSLSTFLHKVAQERSVTRLQDRLWRITEHARSSLERLFRSLSESPRREHAMLHVRSVRELDANSFIKLSNRPGRNIREKIAGRPYLQGVRRFQSVDLPENRLLKAFVTRLSELLELRRHCLGEEQDELLPKIESWLLSDAAQALARWDNLPPNNTLLSHRDYRRIWDAWRWLQAIDDDIAHDLSQVARREDTMRYWRDLGRMHREGTHRFADMPLLFDYQAFAIQPWVSSLPIRKMASRPLQLLRTGELHDAACVDLTTIRPRYACGQTATGFLRETYIWQEWRNDLECVDITLFTSDAAYLHPNATSIASRDLFSRAHDSPEYLDRAARAFAARLRDTFKHDTLLWLVPDFLNDFELETIRRNLNACFPGAEPLPRSVAAAFEQVDYSKITRDGYSIVVVDAIDGSPCVTKLVARFDPDLKKHAPETNGYYWERCPPVIISHQSADLTAGNERAVFDLMTVDAKGQWRDSRPREVRSFIEPGSLKHNPRIGAFDSCINLTASPVAGGVRLHALQQRSGKIPLWRDRIPELAIRVMKDGRYQRFYLVSRGTTVGPIRGRPVSIPVQDMFTLPAGKSFYQFPLFQGENANELGFAARLGSPAFPLKQDTACILDLTFEYGADEPYGLTFTPLDKSFPPVRAAWRRTVEEIVTDAPGPRYPEPISWTDLQRVPKPDGTGTSDLLEWVLSAIERLDRDIFVRPRQRSAGTICAEWREDKKGQHYSFAECAHTAPEEVFIHQASFVEGVDFHDFEAGDQVSFELVERSGKYSGRKVAHPDYIEETRLRPFDDGATEKVVSGIRSRLYFPTIQVWREGRSIRDPECPKDFAAEAGERIGYLAGLLHLTELPQPVIDELLFMLACLHKDAPRECVQWITGQVDSNAICDRQAVGFALGDVSEEWQQRIFRRLASHPDNAAISVFADAIWREQHFVEHFTISELRILLDVLSSRLANLQAQHNKDGTWSIAAKPLELLLGLLRTRASTHPEIKEFLQPHQKITKALARHLDRVEEIVAQSNVKLFSRVRLDIQKPKGVRTPDLLYALRLYLTGDDGANAIHITGVADADND